MFIGCSVSLYFCFPLVFVSSCVCFLSFLFLYSQWQNWIVCQLLQCKTTFFSTFFFVLHYKIKTHSTLNRCSHSECTVLLILLSIFFAFLLPLCVSHLVHFNFQWYVIKSDNHFTEREKKKHKYTNTMTIRWNEIENGQKKKYK